MILVGNKCDLENERVISQEEGASFAQQNNMFFIETSAKVSNITEEFIKVVREYINKSIMSSI